MKRLRTIYYCKKCAKWTGLEQKCPDCGAKTEPKEVPTRRNSLYYIDGIEKPLVSVTTILQALAKPQLIYWAAKTAGENALADPTISAQEAASSIYKKRDSAGDRGSDVHRMIEKGEYGKSEDLPDRVKGYIQAYEKWSASFVKKFILKENTVHSKKFEYAGTLDAIVEDKDGKVWLIDYKTSKALYAETGLQLSAYKEAMLEMKVIKKVDGIAGLLLKADGTFEFREYPNDFKIFLALKEVYDWNDKS